MPRATFAPALPLTCRARAPATAIVPCAARAASCSCSSVRAPMPRGGKLTTRRNAPSSSGFGDQPQVGQRMLDLGALEEAHAAVDAVRHAGVEQRMLDHARLRVASDTARAISVERAAPSSRRGALHHVDDELRLVEVGRRRVTRAPARPCPRSVHRFLPRRVCVVPDQRVGRVEDVAVRAVVLLELDQLHGASDVGTRARSAAMLPTLRAAERIDATGRRRRPRTPRVLAVRASIFSHAYCSALVSWNSSTRMCEKRRW